MKKYVFMFFFALIIVMSLLVNKTHTRNFYVSNSGNDNNSGTCVSSPWQSLSKVNSFNFKPGDVIHFKCGDIWREQLIPVSGNETSYIKYTSYGIGNKPLFLGSIDKSNKDDWIYVGNNIWMIKTADSQIISKRSIPSKDISLYTSEGLNNTMETAVNKHNKEFINIKCVNSGQSSNDIQLIIKGLKIESNKFYKLAFNAKTDASFSISSIKLMKSASLWDNYSSNYSVLSSKISTEYTSYSIIFQSNSTDENARITFYLGSALKTASSLYLDSLTFSEAKVYNILRDVGNIIFNDGLETAIKVANESELKLQNQFWYDKNNYTIKIYSSENPSLLYNEIECAVTRNIVEESNRSYIKYNGLSLKYGGAHGIGGANTHHIIIQNCDFSYIGGGEQYYVNEKMVRFGNGIEFWDNAHDNLVSNCKLFEIYDAALTNQGVGKDGQQFNINYKNNIISNCEYSYESWYKNKSSNIHDIFFQNNICKNAGYGWGHAQRSDPSGRHLRFGTNNGWVSHIVIKNNTFDTAADSNVYLDPSWTDTSALSFIENNYSQKINSTVLFYNEHRYLNSKNGTFVLPISKYTDEELTKIINKLKNY